MSTMSSIRSNSILGLLSAACLLSITACKKETRELVPEPSLNPSSEIGAPKSAGDAFIGLTTAAVVDFKLCPGAIPLRTNANGAILYGCNAPCTNADVNIQDGYGGVICLVPGIQYKIRATSVPASRNTLVFTLPAAYNECTLNPATKFGYNTSTGVWLSGPPLNGVVWSQGVLRCP